MRALLVLVLLLAGAGGAAAQAPSGALALDVDFPDDTLLMPWVEQPGFPSAVDVTVRFPVNVTYVFPPGEPPGAITRVTLGTPEVPIWLAVSLVPSTWDIPAPPPSLSPTEVRREGVAVVYARNTAPALTQGVLSIHADAERLLVNASGLRGVRVAQADAKGQVFASPYVVFETFVADRTVELERHGDATLELRVANRGNEVAVAAIEVSHAPAGLVVRPSAMPTILRPNPLAFQLEREARAVPVTIEHESGEGGEVLLLVRNVAPSANRTLVQEHVVRMHVAVVGGAPPGGAWATLLAVGVAAAVVLTARRAG